MSVLVSDRKESRFEALIYSLELHDMILDLSSRNFGVRDVNNYVRSRYAHGRIQSEDFPFYRLQMHKYKERLEGLAYSLTTNLRAAKSIYPTSMHEYEKRRDFLNNAIVNCEEMLKDLQRVVDIFDVDLNLYGRYVKAISREIDLIKRWRQRDNKLKSSLQG